DVAQRAEVFGEHRFFDEEQLVGFQLLDEDFGHRLVHAAMEVDADAEVLTSSLPDRLDVLDDLVDLGVGVDELQLLGGVHLHGSESTVLRLQCGSCGVAGAVSADPRVRADPIPDLPTEQLMNRLTERLALDVPQGLVDSGDRTHENGATAVEATAVHDRPQVFDVRWVLADEQVGELIDGGSHRGGFAFEDGLTPTDDPFVGFNLEKQ